MTDSNDVAISKKADFRILIEDGLVVIADADNKRGGNLLTNRGKWVSWRNETGGTCRLVLRKLLGEGESGDGDAAWPFDPAQVPPSAELEMPKDFQAGRNPWRGKLANVDRLSCFEYKVHVRMDDCSSYELDPVIIVRT
jgi:hypothetical protein